MWGHGFAKSSMDSEQQLHALIATLYDTAAEPMRWRATLSLLADLVGVHGIHFFWWDKRDTRYVFTASNDRIDPEAETKYGAYFHTVDPRLSLIVRCPVGRFMMCQEHFDPDFVRGSEI